MNTFGHFKSQKEFEFTRPDTPRPMLNYLWNSRILSGVNQTGGGSGSYGGRAFTYVDPEDKGRCSVIRDGNRYFYIRDTDSGVVFNPGWYPSKTPLENYSCVHGLGYSLISSECGGVSASLRGFADQEHPCEIWTLTLANKTDKVKRMQVFSFAEFQLEGYTRYSDPFGYYSARYIGDKNLVYCENNCTERPHPWYSAFISSDLKPSGFDSSKKAFMGVYGDIREPEAVKNGACTGSVASCEHMAGVLEHTFTLEAGASVSLNVLIGSTDSAETAVKITDELLFTPDVIEREFEKLIRGKEKKFGDITVSTPDDKVSGFANWWLKQQVTLCAEIGRDGCKGFRDQLQDAWAVAAFDPALARAKILETLRYEYANGQCERGWLPVTNHIYSDGPIWIPLTINAYIKETGDKSILDEIVPYYDHGGDTALGHMLTALRRSSDDVGEHGLVHALEGDWNDSLNMIGIRGKGESVWTSIALNMALTNMAEMAGEILRDDALKAEMEERAGRIAEAVEKHGWDGEWYLAAYNDDGKKVGTHAEKEGMIYLNSQTWGILSGIAKGERLEKCLKALDTRLDSDYGPLTLFPPYTKFNDTIGRLTSFVPGIWENGTPYCHGGTFKIVSDCFLGRGDDAYETMLKIMPDGPRNSSDASGCEPYVLTNMYFGPDNPRRGQTMFAWVTGSAGWMFRSITQYMLGFHPGYGSVTMNPCIPAAWAECGIKRVFRGDTYLITLKNPEHRQSGVKELIVDGKAVKGNTFEIFGDGKEHSVVVTM
ncbi:MAG: hypothetical protein FWF44_06100 [Defluviitaleaceae bacterium]|nr:hypothetical protein [Defluviitaleaceae bacterium]